MNPLLLPVAAGFLSDVASGFQSLPAGSEPTVGWVVGKILLVVLIVHALLIFGALMVWLERRVAAWIQDRIGPNRVGPQGLLQPLADLGKFIFKEDVIPAHVNKWMFVVAPVIALIPSMITFAVIPFTGHQWSGEGQWRSIQVADLDIGILYILSIASIGVYGITLGGWASNSKYSLLGGVRSSAQMMSYELPLGLSLVPLVLIASTLSLSGIVEWQRTSGWFVFHQPLAFFLFLVASYAETNRLPFDLPEAETELVAGYHTEYSAMKFALFFLAEYSNMIVASALVTTCFLGGWTLFGLESLGWFAGLVIFLTKMLALLFLYIWVRWTLPRFRYDQLMGIGWGWFIPLALLNLILTAGAEASGQRWIGWALPVVLVAIGVGSAWWAWRRDRRSPRVLSAEGARAAAVPGEGR